MLARILGRRVPAEWVALEMKAKGKLDYEVEAFPMAVGYFALRLRNEEDKEAMLGKGLWIVAGQLLALERWQPDFVLGRKEVSKVVVWLRLPGLPLEYWRKESIWEIATEAGVAIEVDGFTEDHRRMGYARIKVEVDASLPVRLGVFIRGKEGKLWQSFMYEYLPPVYYQCGRLGHGGNGCRSATPESAIGNGGSGATATEGVKPDHDPSGQSGSAGDGKGGRRAFGP
ncbi:uncharacterized protein LOC120108429 [Phoenix dactylifera]|uniref:Uncharacterized protein LOC120108429 n=1 Tax=Phoenix dactylifera TaxID=42345 RepID=A0A8B8ZUK9_PHODC|nr:uncharacterized protein LOC120108429 [Phoenix dactylifera]